MGRRKGDVHPVPKLHRPTGHARVRINGKEYWLGRYGSAEAKLRHDELIAAWLASGRQSVEAATAPRPKAAAAPRASAPKAADVRAGSLTVGELALRWLEHIEASRPNYRKSSLWHGAIAASRAVRPFATTAVEEFGTRALLEVQRQLVETPYRQRKKAKPDEPPPKPQRRSRRYVNDVVRRVRQMFNWGVLNELVADDRVKALEIVPALTRGATKARETKPRKPVRPSIVRATMPHMTAEVADLIWFIRLTGCRPSEACRMRLVDIRDRDRNVWRYTPKRHKTAHRGKHRHIAIGPQAQAIILAHTAGRDPHDYVFTPQRSVPPRKPREGVIPIEPRKPSPLAGKMFTKDGLMRAVHRAIEKANKAREEAGDKPLPRWTPYQLRYTRLREIRKRFGREAARGIAGHSKATMTDHYAPAGWGRTAKAALTSG